MEKTYCEMSVKERIDLSQKRNFPIEIHIEPTNHCNKKCFMCPTRHRYKRDIFPMGYMDFELYKAIIDEAVSVHGGDLRINLHKDGEPLMHPQIGDMIKYAKSYGAFVHFATNGLLVGKKKEELVESGLDLLTVSTIDQTAIKALTAFAEYKKDRPPYTQVKLFFGTKPIVPEIENVEVYLFLGWHEWTDAEPFDRKAPCTKIMYSMAITWEGLFNPCCLDYRRDMVLGKFPEDTIAQAWTELQKVYQNQHKGIWIKPCNTCDYFQRLNEDETKITAEWEKT